MVQYDNSSWMSVMSMLGGTRGTDEIDESHKQYMRRVNVLYQVPGTVYSTSDLSECPSFIRLEHGYRVILKNHTLVSSCLLSLSHLLSLSPPFTDPHPSYPRYKQELIPYCSSLSVNQRK